LKQVKKLVEKRTNMQEANKPLDKTQLTGGWPLLSEPQRALAIHESDSQTADMLVSPTSNLDKN
jgi:hypothetical protein